METIINFLEQYWGYTLFGGVSLGTMITFVVTQIKALLKDKNKNLNIDRIVTKANDLCAELTNRNEEQEQRIAALTKRISDQQVEMASRNEYFEKIQAATFQAISYLTIASKLPTEDKIALQQKFTSILENKAVEYKETLKDEVLALEKEVQEKIIPDATETIKTTVAETQSLLDKYTKEG